MIVNSTAGRKTLIPQGPSHDGLDILPRARKTDLFYERQTICRRFSSFPLQHIAAPGVVVGQGVRDGIIRLRVPLQKLFEIPIAS